MLFKINKREKLVYLVGFAIEMYYDAQTYERQTDWLDLRETAW
jgi:hypothetical protein